MNKVLYQQSRRRSLMICINRRFGMGEPSCADRGSEALAEFLETEIKKREINVTVDRCGCMAHCRSGPAIRLTPGGKFYLGPSVKEIAALLDEAETLCGKTTDNNGEMPESC